MLDKFPRPILLAHRGDSSHAPENTLPAFASALEKGADGVELDAQLTADGHVVVIHDPDVKRTTDGEGRISSLSIETVRTLDAGSWFSPVFSGTKVPLLEDVFEAMGRDKLINIELKNYSTPFNGLALKVCELVKRHNNGSQIILSSFFAFNLKIAARELPGIQLGLLALPGWRGSWARSFSFMFGNYQALHLHHSDTTREQIQRTHRIKRRVHVWTVNSPEEIRRLSDWDVDGIITADPGAAVRALGRAK
ncbi:MAG: glycerophosphoryl diester phosphodiesterase [Anaerolineaceae bacterium]|nr:MAG: glycerophosphoryl diester phosphodiesterase [Anaerolineaceae bacterium]